MRVRTELEREELRTKAAEVTGRLVGKFFHSHNWQSSLVRWGKILSEPECGIFLVQLLSWPDGAPTIQELISPSRMAEERWKLYASEEDWLRAAREAAQ